MLARLQQATTLGLLALALAWGWLVWRAGHPAWALGGAALIVFFYAGVLGLEFLLLGWVHGADPAPRAGAWARLRAWWGEVLSAPLVFCWRQPFRSRAWPDHLPAEGRGRRGVLLIHGFVCNRGLWNRWMQRLTMMGVPFVAVNLEPVFGSIDETIGHVEHAMRRLEGATGRTPIVVAHSMGGLVLRRWWAEQGDDRRVHHAITIASPHRGTWIARFAFSRNGQEMRQGSPWLAKLHAAEPPPRFAKFTCFYGHCDNIVMPPSTATLPGADNRHLAGTAHVHMAARAEPWDELLKRLSS